MKHVNNWEIFNEDVDNKSPKSHVDFLEEVINTLSKIHSNIIQFGSASKDQQLFIEDINELVSKYGMK